MVRTVGTGVRDVVCQAVVGVFGVSVVLAVESERATGRQLLDLWRRQELRDVISTRKAVR